MLKQRKQFLPQNVKTQTYTLISNLSENGLNRDIFTRFYKSEETGEF